jgi:hypothetical protein
MVLARLDAGTAQEIEAAVAWLLGAEGERLPLTTVTQLSLQHLLWYKLPVNWLTDEAEHHEIAWGLGDFFAAAGLDRYAALCREQRTHEIIAAWHRDEEEARRIALQAQLDSGVLPPDTAEFKFGELMGPQEAAAHQAASAYLEEGIVSGALDPDRRGFRAAAQRRLDRYLTSPSEEFAGPPLTAVWRERVDQWRSSFRGVPDVFWDRAMPALESAPLVPERPHLSVAPALALMEEVGEGVTLTEAGYLPPKLAIGLDERFGWTEDYALSAPRSEADVRQLMFLHEHLRAQRLLTRRGRRLTVSASGRRAMGDPARLWGAVVGPAPRWRAGFEQDALAVMAVSLLGHDHVSGEQVREEMTSVLSRKWRPKDGGPIDDDVWWVEVEWLRVGLALGWWQNRRRAAEQRLSEFGRVAAACAFRSAATGPMGG